MDRRKAIRNTGLLAGAAIAMPSLLSLLQSCKSETRLEWQPLFLDKDEALFISAIVDMILPRTETPGALDVNVDVFLDKFFAKILDDAGQQDVRSAIARFNEDCRQQFGDVFIKLNEKKRIAALKWAENTSGKFGGSVWGTAVGKQEPVGFYRSLKSMAIWAYFSSEEIGEKVLNYDPIPQNYLGCIPLAEVGNRWSL